MKLIDNHYVVFWGSDWPSNFAESPIKVYDEFWERSIWDSLEDDAPEVVFKTAEAYYQSRKAVLANDPRSYYSIINASTPAETKKIARKIKLDVEKWDSVKVDEMKKTLKLKFSQNPSLTSQLLSPKYDGCIFVEASPYDKFWGVGLSESDFENMMNTYKSDVDKLIIKSLMGENWLGTLLTELRNELIIDKSIISSILREKQKDD